MKILFLGIPVALSRPHFYKSDPALLDDFDGLEPNKDKHESHFGIQPVS